MFWFVKRKNLRFRKPLNRHPPKSQKKEHPKRIGRYHRKKLKELRQKMKMVRRI